MDERTFEQRTADNRNDALNNLGRIIMIAGSQIDRVRSIPLLDDEEHADLVQGFVDRIHEIMLDMEDLTRFGKGSGSND